MDIQSLLTRDLQQRIEEVVKVAQDDEATVKQEILEYVATDRILQHYRILLKAIDDAPTDQHESVGVWISGFFGSGKSSFAKNLGYMLSNKEIEGQSAVDLFKERFADQEISLLLDSISRRIKTDVIMFDISVSRDMRKGNEHIAEIMYRELLQHLDYCETDYGIAELEMSMEETGRLESFKDVCQRLYGPWERIRIGAERKSQASTILHELDSHTYPTSETWANIAGSQQLNVTVEYVVEKTFELMRRRGDNKSLAFVIDEVGQYVAQRTDRIENLRAVVERFGVESRNRLRRREITAPVWVIVTSQEKLDEIVAALDSKRVELAKVQDRFRHRVDLAPADIREVATRRVLSKTQQGETTLAALFSQNEGQLKNASRLEQSTRQRELKSQDFTRFYPYLPHFIDLSIDIMSGIRLQPGAPSHMGGSNRTIIKQTHEMLVSPRTHLAAEPIGTLVTIDGIYELVEGNLPTEKQKDISDIQDQFSYNHWAARVGKAISLLGYVSNMPSTPHNIAALLVDKVGQPAPLPEVEAAIAELERSQFIRRHEDGYKLQTAQERRWDDERKGFTPQRRERNEIMRAALGEIFDDQFRTFQYRSHRTFRIGLNVDGHHVGEEGQVAINIVVGDDADDYQSETEKTRVESRQEANQYELYWAFLLTPEVAGLLEQVHASGKMIAKYNQQRAQGHINRVNSDLLADEKLRIQALQRQLRDQLLAALKIGQSIFRGKSRDATEYGQTLGEMLRSFVDSTIPSIYPKIDMGLYRVKSDDIDHFLKATNLNGLAQVFYQNPPGELVIQQDMKYIPNAHAQLTQEVLNFLRQRSEYKERASGRELQDHFVEQPVYGWTPEVLKLALAILFRAGEIEIIYQARRYQNYQDPNARQPFNNTTAFRNASFMPKVALSNKMLRDVADLLEQMVGREIDLDAVKIGQESTQLANEEKQRVTSLLALARARQLPIVDQLEDYQRMLADLLQSEGDDKVSLLAQTGQSIKTARDQVRTMSETLTEQHLEWLDQARRVIQGQWPRFQIDISSDLEEQAEELKNLILQPTFYTQFPRIHTLAETIHAAYAATYLSAHNDRSRRYGDVVAAVQESTEWSRIPEDVYTTVLQPLTRCNCAASGTLDIGSIACSQCLADIATLLGDIDALPTRQLQVLRDVRQRIAPPPTSDVPIRRRQTIYASEFFASTLDSPAAVDDAIERLRQRLLDLIADGAEVIVE